MLQSNGGRRKKKRCDCLKRRCKDIENLVSLVLESSTNYTRGHYSEHHFFAFCYHVFSFLIPLTPVIVGLKGDHVTSCREFKTQPPDLSLRRANFAISSQMEIRMAKFVDTLKKVLKTHLFSEAFHSYVYVSDLPRVFKEVLFCKAFYS